MERLLAVPLFYSLGHAGIATWHDGGERRALTFVFHACLALSAFGWRSSPSTAGIS